MRKTKQVAMLVAVLAITSSMAIPAASANTDGARERDHDATTTTVDHDRVRLRQCDRDRAPDRPVDCRVDPHRRLQCDRDRAVDRPLDCRTDGLRPALARCIHWALENTTLEPGGGYRFWATVCRRIAWNIHHPL